ncbi:MAG TPA: AI-2E family transporter [Gemmatimonadales bacterium]|nr:AI-2E family transporter [Gemmatimonadales bacterium]
MDTRSTEDSAPGEAFRPEVPAPAGPAEEGGAVEQPDLRKLGEALRDRIEVRSIAITGLLVLAVLYTLYFARAFLLPIVLAVLLDFLLSPIIRLLKRIRIPEPAGAALVILVLLGALGAGVYSLAEPARDWMARAPESIARVQSRLEALQRPVEQVTRTAERVEAATEVEKSGPQEVVVRGPRLSERLFGTTQSLLTGAMETVILLYFLLAAGDLFLQKLIKVLPLLRDKKKAVAIARETEASISTYLFTLTFVNIGLGLVVTLVMTLIGMPNAVLWGSLAALAEFVPYVGATVMIALLTMAGIVNFPTMGHALLVPGAYLAVNLIQANFISPMVLGRRLTLNPVAILVGLVFWWWLWGVGGAFIAVPLLATLKIFCDHIESLAPIGEFLGK